MNRATVIKILVIVILVVAIVGVSYMVYTNIKSKNTVSTTVTFIKPPEIPQYPSDYPDDLIFERTLLSKSYSIKTPEDQKGDYLEYITNNKIGSVFSMYKAFLEYKQWLVASSSSNTGGTGKIVASKGQQRISVDLTKQADLTFVSIRYQK